MSTFTTTATTTGTLDPWKRVRYSLGLVLGEAEFQQEQLYLTERDDRHHRALHGAGVVSGLAVAFDADGDQIGVAPGLAVDGHGRWVCVPAEQCVTVANLAAWLADQDDVTPNEDGTVSIWVTLCHLDCATDLIPIPSGPCKTADESMSASRLADGFRLDLSLTAPSVVGEPAAEELADLLTALTTGAADADADPATDPAVGIRRRLAEWAATRPDHPGVDSACLDADGCVALAELRVAVSAPGVLDQSVAPDIGPGTHPPLISTGLLTEWLAALSAEVATIEDVALALDDLTDVDVGGAGDGQLLSLSGDTWTAVDPPAAGGGPPTGPAGGDLRRTYPNPEVDGLLGLPIDDTLPDDRRRALAWDPFERGWQAQSFVHGPAGPIAIVAAADFPAFEEVPVDEYRPYNLRVDWLAQPLTYNLAFVGYQPPREVRYVVKGDVVLNVNDVQLRRFAGLLGIDDQPVPKPFELMVVRYQGENIRVQLGSNARLPDAQGPVPLDVLQEFFPDLRVQVEVTAYGAIQDMLGTIPRVEV